MPCQPYVCYNACLAAKWLLTVGRPAPSSKKGWITKCKFTESGKSWGSWYGRSQKNSFSFFSIQHWAKSFLLRNKVKEELFWIVLVYIAFSLHSYHRLLLDIKIALKWEHFFSVFCQCKTLGSTLFLWHSFVRKWNLKMTRPQNNESNCKELIVVGD